MSNVLRKLKEKQEIKQDAHKKKYSHLWDELGFHKNIAGNEYEYVLSLISIPIMVVLFPILLGNFFPFPEIKGYQEISAGFMAFLFGVFDLGTGGTSGNMSETFMRFISQYRAKDPKRAIGYIQFFNFFQMTTGLIQITGISIYVFTVLIHQTLAHFAWFFWYIRLSNTPGCCRFLNPASKDSKDLIRLIWWPLCGIISGTPCSKLS